MPSSPLFAAVVTHARSRFNVDGAAGAMLGGLAAALEQQGVATETLVSDRNDYDPEVLPITSRLLASSARHQARLEHRWRRYLADAGGTARPAAADVLVREAMWAKRLTAALGVDPRADAVARPGAPDLVRLLNIDLSHLRVLDAAAERGAPWVLVLEDDAGIDDHDRAARSIRWLLDRLPGTGVSFANLSESIPLDELGVAPLLVPADDLVPPPDLGFTVMRARRPVTNTVCATLYEGGYARALADAIRSRGLTPVAPIDWRVNEVIMDMVGAGRLDERSCVWVTPGLLLQRSMHA